MRDLRTGRPAILVGSVALLTAACIVDVADPPTYYERPAPTYEYVYDADETCDSFDAYLDSCTWFCVQSTWECPFWFEEQNYYDQELLYQCAECLYSLIDTCEPCITDLNEDCADVLADSLGQEWCY